MIIPIEFIMLLSMVESIGNPHAIGRHGELGMLQMTSAYVQDAAEYAGKDWTHEDAIDEILAIKIFRAYMARYAAKERQSRPVTLEDIARIHNGGPNGYLKKINKVILEKSTMGNETTIYVASAGTGKTTTLMELLTDCLEETDPKKICFTTFTKAGAQEAIDRALVKNPSYVLSDFEGFSTLHALCYRRVPRKQMLSNEDYKLLSELTGYSITGNTAYDSSGMMYYNNTGDRILYYNSLGRNLKISAKEVLNLQIGAKLTAEQLDDFNKFYIEFKTQKNKYDFTDQLEQYIAQGIRPNFDYVFIDEAQDLSPLQWDVVDFISKGATKVFIAGDDKQSIFKFAGGDPSSLIHKGNRIVLDTSYRLPAKVLNYAEKLLHESKKSKTMQWSRKTRRAR